MNIDYFEQRDLQPGKQPTKLVVLRGKTQILTRDEQFSDIGEHQLFDIVIPPVQNAIITSQKSIPCGYRPKHAMPTFIIARASSGGNLIETGKQNKHKIPVQWSLFLLEGPSDRVRGQQG